jgi:hypothetical protein
MTTALDVQVSLVPGLTLETWLGCAATLSGPSLDGAFSERLSLLPICVISEDADGPPSLRSVKESDGR